MIVRLKGDLTELRYVEHPDFAQAPFSYFIPPNGVHDLIIPNAAGSFYMFTPTLLTYTFEATGDPDIHRLRSIRDRFANELRFTYDVDGRLAVVNVNSQYRYVSFQYDTFNRIKAIADHTGRNVLYTYDDRGFLNSVAGPSAPGASATALEAYEYVAIGRFQKLAAVYDSRRRLIIENEYDTSAASETFGRLLRQLQNRGDTTFLYSPALSPSDDTLPIADRTVSEVLEYRRNGHEVVHRLNSLSLEVMRTERLLVDGQLRRLTTRTRYNADGSVIARLEPDGTLHQFLFGREETERRRGPWPELDHVIAAVPAIERIAFGNLFAEVTRARRVGYGGPDAERFDWDMVVPDVRATDSPHDHIVKYRYDPRSGLVTSQSDPRYTLSADSDHVESAEPGSPLYNAIDPRYVEHQRHLTRLEYGGLPRLELQRRVLPDRTRPSVVDGVSKVQGLTEQYTYDSRGRLLRRIDVRGYEWWNEYYAASDGAREGYLKRHLRPHVDWQLDKDRPTILEVQLQGKWTIANRCLLSGGASRDALVALVDGVRILLSQSTDLAELVGRDKQVIVAVDGRPLIPWDQSRDPSYLIAGLTLGPHRVVVRGTSNTAVALGRIQSHVADEFIPDALGNVVQQTDGRGIVQSVQVDSLGRQTLVARGSGATRSVTEFQYDGDGNCVLELKQWCDEFGTPRPEGSRETQNL